MVLISFKVSQRACGFSVAFCPVCHSYRCRVHHLHSTSARPCHTYDFLSKLRLTENKIKSYSMKLLLWQIAYISNGGIGSTVHGIFLARILEWAAVSFSMGSSQPRDQTRVSCIADRRFTVWARLRLNASGLDLVSSRSGFKFWLCHFTNCVTLPKLPNLSEPDSPCGNWR